MNEDLNEYHKSKREILSYLDSIEEPAGVEPIRRKTDIGNWNTVLKHCLELTIDGKIRGRKTSNGWIFERNGGRDEGW